MAEEENKENENGEAEGGSGSKKTIIIIALVVLLAIGISVGVTLFLLGDDTAEESDEAVAEEQEAAAQYMDLTPAFLVTFNVNGRQRYMQAHVSISSKFASNLSQLEHHMPLIRSRLSSAFSTQEFSVLQTDEGKKALLETLKNTINEVLESEEQKPIDKVYFTNFVLQ